MPRKIRYDLDQLDDDVLKVINQPEPQLDLLGTFRQSVGTSPRVKPPRLGPVMPKIPRLPKV